MPHRAPPNGRNYGGETQAERKARRRQQFLTAGLDVFGTAGYRQATVRKLCRQAQLTDRYFYEEFGTTEDLLLAVYLDAIERIRTKLTTSILEAQEPSSEVSREEQTDVLIRSTLDAFFAAIEDARVLRVVWFEVLGISPRVDQTYTDSIRSFAGLVLQLAQVVHPALDPEAAQHRMTAVSLVGAVSEAAKQWLLNDYREPRALMVEATAPLFLGVMQYLTRLPAASR